MQRQCSELVPIAEALADLPDPGEGDPQIFTPGRSTFGRVASQ